MNGIRAVLREIAGLFVDDGSLAVAVLVWLALVWLGVRWAGSGIASLRWVGPVFFAGLGFILLENVLRSARRSGRSKK